MFIKINVYMLIKINNKFIYDYQNQDLQKNLCLISGLKSKIKTNNKNKTKIKK